MERDKLSELNVFQSLGLAVLASTLTALAVVYLLRLRRRTSSRTEPEVSTQQASGTTTSGVAPADISPQDAADVSQPAVNTVTPAEVPHHFSEDLIVPGLTHTGPEIASEDDKEGRSPDGV